MQMPPPRSSVGSSRSPPSLPLLCPSQPTRRRPADLSHHHRDQFADPAWLWDHRALQEAALSALPITHELTILIFTHCLNKLI